MSRENADLVRGIYDRGDFDRSPSILREVADPDLEMVNPPDAVEGGTRRGREEIIASLEHAFDSFEWTRHEAIEVFDGGDQVVASVRFTAKGGGSGVELEQLEAHTWSFRDGKVVRFEWGRDLDAARAAAGV